MDLKLFESIGKKASLSAFNFVDYRNETLSNFLFLKLNELVQSGDIIKKGEPQIKTEDVYEVIATIDIGEQPTEIEISNEALMEIDDEEVKVVQDGTKQKRKNRKANMRKGKITCTLCHLQFISKSELTKHTRKEHPDFLSEFKCPKCNKTLSSKYSLRRHTMMHGDGRELSCCTLCPLEFTSKFELIKHIHKGHPDFRPKFKCPQCTKTFSYEYNLKRHIKNKHENGEESLRCILCHLEFISKSELTKHTRREHLNLRSELKCPKCNKTFYIKSQLRRHIMKHVNGKDLLQCTLCPSKFISKAELTKHTLKEHPDFRPGFKCARCKTNFQSRRYLRLHMKKHNDKTKIQDKGN